MDEFEAMYREHFSGVYRYALALCRDTALAEELTQETFFRAMENLEGFRGQCSLFVWLCQITKNQYFTLCRKRKRLSDEGVPEDSGGSTEADLFEREDARLLHRLLHELPEPYKEVFSLRVFGELPFAQIGELFGKSDGWARLIFYRAKNELRRQLDE